MKTSRETAQDTLEMEGYEGHFSDLGGYTVGFETYSSDADLADLFKGLPDDHCQCPHWGIVLKGKLTYRYADETEETIPEGEAYFRPARASSLPSRRNRGRRVQPHQRAAADGGSHQQEHGIRRLGRSMSSRTVGL